MVLQLSALVAPKENLYFFFFPALPPVLSSVPLSLNHPVSLPFSSTSTLESLAEEDIHYPSEDLPGLKNVTRAISN